METDRFDELTAKVARGLSRRRSLGVLAASGTVGALVHTASDDQTLGKRGKKVKGKASKKCRACPVCPLPPTPGPAAFCAGKNDCAQTASVPCQASGTNCFCYIRQDNASSMCGVFSTGISNCASCPTGTVCVLGGGTCGGGFGCITPCPNPR